MAIRTRARIIFVTGLLIFSIVIMLVPSVTGLMIRSSHNAKNNPKNNHVVHRSPYYHDIDNRLSLFGSSHQHAKQIPRGYGIGIFAIGRISNWWSINKRNVIPRLQDQIEIDTLLPTDIIPKTITLIVSIWKIWIMIVISSFLFPAVTNAKGCATGEVSIPSYTTNPFVVSPDTRESHSIFIGNDRNHILAFATSSTISMENNNNNDDPFVAFAEQLQKSSNPNMMFSSATPLSTTSSEKHNPTSDNRNNNSNNNRNNNDIEDALLKSSKKKAIDPRTHG